MNAIVTNPLTALQGKVAAGSLLTDEANRELYRHDVYSAGPAPLAVFRPSSVEELAAGIGAATAAGIAIVPRGGGMSYTGGYISPTANFILIDTARLNRVIAVNETDMTVTVECGITWEELRRELQPRGLRTRTWGTLSGINATVGGGMSQNGVFWGAGGGTVVDSALSFDVVLADGAVVSTGSSFFRPYGPDLTGLFAADCGAFGVKARATLRLVREGAAFAYGSFSFDNSDQLFAGMSAKMMKAQGSILKGIKEGAKVALAGRSFLDDVPFSLHCITERRRQNEADADMAEITRLIEAAGGKAIENTIPKILRANPFPPVNSMVGPDGERWVPVHGFLPHSKLVEGWAAVQALFASRADEMAALGVNAGAMLAAVSPQVCLIEPVFFWPDELNPLHRQSVEPAHLAKLKGFPANAASTALVHELRAAVVDAFQKLGAVHLQIARTYPLKNGHSATTWGLLKELKAKVDPKGLMNPGSLGL